MYKISVITVCFNSASTLEDTLCSVISQDHPAIEYIVVDGGSVDQSMEIINKYKGKISRVISEKDNGLYDAINKGIAVATGDIVAILHADDLYFDSQVLSKVADVFVKNNCDSVYGDLYYVDRNNVSTVRRNWVSGEYKKENFLKGWMPPHPAFFAKRSCYERFGNYNTDFKSAADYELMLRFLYKNNVSACYLPQVLVRMRVGGKSNRSLLNRLKANREDKRAWDVNGIHPGMFTFIRKPLSKLGQFFGA